MFNNKQDFEPFSQEWYNRLAMFENFEELEVLDLPFTNGIKKGPFLVRDHKDGPYVVFKSSIRWLTFWERFLLLFKILPKEFKSS